MAAKGDCEPENFIIERRTLQARLRYYISDVIIILDCCHSAGSLGETIAGDKTANVGGVSKLLLVAGWIVTSQCCQVLLVVKVSQLLRDRMRASAR
jgi:hypothetical protein